MALRAGYYGVKRWLFDKLQTIPARVDTAEAEIKDINNVTGVKNLLAVPYANDSWSTAQGLSASVNTDGSITLSGTLSAATSIMLHGRSGQSDRNPFTLDAGTYIVSKNIVAGVILELNILKSGVKYVIADVGANTESVKFTLEESAQIGVQLITATGTTSVSGTIKPMIRLASDPDNTYVPYAKTNRQLTESADDQKTAINAIISAATGAADFAAFKTAMAALTPLTRSAAPDTREASPEVIADDPEPVTKTTRKSTKKEDN